MVKNENKCLINKEGHSKCCMKQTKIGAQLLPTPIGIEIVTLHY